MVHQYRNSQLMGTLDSLKMLTKLSMSLRFLSIFLIILSVVVSVSATNSIIYTECSKFCFDSLTPYESNLNSLFTSLIDSSSLCNFNKFQISQNNVPVYGLFQCQGDVSSSQCNDCVTNSINQLKTTCPMSVGGTIQLDGCFVKYDKSSFFGTQNKTEVLKICGPSVGYNSDVLNRIDDALTCLTGENEQYFRSGAFGILRGVAQCIQDLSISDCQDCLSEACGRLRTECDTSSSANIFLGKCYLGYADQVDVNCHHCSSNSDTSCCVSDDARTYNGSPSSNKSASCCGIRNINKILMWIAIIVGTFVIAICVTFIVTLAIKKGCTNVFCCRKLFKLEKDVESANKKIKELADAKAKEEAKKHHPKEEKPVNECPKAQPPCRCPPPYPPYYPPYPPSYPACHTHICVTESSNGCVLM